MISYRGQRRALQRLGYIGRPAAIPVPLQCRAKSAGSWRLHTKPISCVRSSREVIAIHVRAIIVRQCITATCNCADWRQNCVAIERVFVGVGQSAIRAAPSH